jgi:hypothetical protein
MLTDAGLTGLESGPAIIRSQVQFFVQLAIAKKKRLDIANRDELRTR